MGGLAGPWALDLQDRGADGCPWKYKTPLLLSTPSLSLSLMLRHINPLTAEPLQTEAQVRTPATSHENADTSITPQGGRKKKKHVELDEEEHEETFIHLFCLFSKTNRGRIMPLLW